MQNVQFSIYKIDIEKIDKDKIAMFSEVNEKNRVIIKILLDEIKENIKSKYKPFIYNIDYDGYIGVLYRTSNNPNWNEMILELSNKIGKNINFDIENINVSYILFYSVNECIYVMTAGFGSHLIKCYIERNWGLYLMPKILGENEGVIRTVKENNIYGNELSISKANRNVTNLSSEKEIRTVFREFSIEIDDNITELFGISDFESNGKMSVILKDSLNLRKSISLVNLKEVLNKVYEIEKIKDKYSLGYFGQINSVGISKKDLFDLITEKIVNNEYDSIAIVGEDYLKYCIDSKEFILIDDEGDEFYKSSIPITIEKLIEVCSEKNKLSKTYIGKVLKKWSIKTVDDCNNIILYPQSVFDSLDGIVEYGDKKIPCYLSQGQWYYFSLQYNDFLNKEFKSLFDESSGFISGIKKKYKLSKNAENENKYNDSFFDDKNVIVAHKSLISNIEIADLIFWDEESIYLMCNKMKFDASGSRDLINQLLVSAKFLQAKLHSIDKDAFLDDYYEKIHNRYNSNKKKMIIEKNGFKNLFSLNIVYIAGYLSGYEASAQSNYAKFLSVDCNRNLTKQGYKFFSMNI